MIDSIWDYLNQKAFDEGYNTKDSRAMEEFIRNVGELISQYDYDFRRWEYTYFEIRKVDDRFIRFRNNGTLGDLEIDSSMDLSAVEEVEPYEETVVKYRTKE